MEESVTRFACVTEIVGGCGSSPTSIEPDFSIDQGVCCRRALPLFQGIGKAGGELEGILLVPGRRIVDVVVLCA